MMRDMFHGDQEEIASRASRPLTAPYFWRLSFALRSGTSEVYMRRSVMCQKRLYGRSN
jgi:hypothetical protein